MRQKHPPLGQHFLTSKRALETIVRKAALSSPDHILEIGPGKGVLTEALLRTAQHVIAVEKDPRLVTLLRERFSEQIANRQLTLLEEDILHFDPTVHGLQDGDYKIVANIPYYITGEVLRYFLAGKCKPERMVLLVQKEVAERIARDKKESILSLSVKVYGEPHYVQTVSAKAFRPPPAVDSAILTIENISREKVNAIDEMFLFSVIKSGFAQKRKLLKSNLREFASSEEIVSIFDALGIVHTARAEDVSLSTWIELAVMLYKVRKSAS